MVLQNKTLWIGVLIVGLCLREVTPCWYDSTSDKASLWYLNKNTCGSYEDNGKIVGGDSGSVINWPWLGFLEANGAFRCTVTLIAWNWATTSASCVDGYAASSLKVTFGQSNKQWTHGQVRNINKIIMHTGYTTFTDSNNIALLRLDSPVTYSGIVRPVCLPYSSFDSFYDNCYVAGWGEVGEDGESPQVTDQLHELKVTIKTNAECHSQDGIDHVAYPILDEHICADKEDDNGNPVFGGGCKGDGGGPLMCKVESFSDIYPQEWSLIGITSHSFGGCGNADYFEVFTRASKFNQWITDRVDENGGPFII